MEGKLHRGCPKCGGELHPFEIEGAGLDLCEACGGRWFDDDELIHFLKAQAGVKDLEVGSSRKKPAGAACPRCASRMEEMDFELASDLAKAAGQDLWVDRCPNCGGIWLDAGEFDKVKAVAEKVGDEKSKMCRVLRKMEGTAQPPARLRGLKIAAAVLALLAAAALFHALTKNRAESKGAPSPAAPAVCKACNGTGKTANVCFRCRGTGRLTKQEDDRGIECPECGGQGTVFQPGRSACARCRGSGSVVIPQRNCDRCGGSGKVDDVTRKICSACYGSGQISVRETCGVCGGTGKSSVNPQWGCPACKGGGRVASQKTCPQCLGGTVDVHKALICPACRGKRIVAAEKKLCDSCAGTGQSSPASPPVLCKRCAGTGMIEGSVAKVENCSTCQGRGSLGEIPCAACGGKGTL